MGDRDRQRFLAILASVAGKLDWSCLGYCLMPNHFHLVFRTPEPTLSTGMHALNGCYARWFNAQHDLSGHLFERRFHSVLLEGNAHLVWLSRYLALNPVRAGLCTHPGDWPWGSFRGVVGFDDEPEPFLAIDEILAQFGTTRERAREQFVAFVTATD